MPGNSRRNQRGTYDHIEGLNRVEGRLNRVTKYIKLQFLARIFRLYAIGRGTTATKTEADP